MDATRPEAREGRPDPDAGRDVAPVDYDTLDRIGEQLAPSARFDAVELVPEYATDSVVVEYDLEYFPALVERAYLRIRWFENGDFNVHYSEQYGDDDPWECRWDRHPNDHNDREHFHPPPDAETPGRGESYPTDFRDVIARVLEALDERIEEFWEWWIGAFGVYMEFGCRVVCTELQERRVCFTPPSFLKFILLFRFFFYSLVFELFTTPVKFFSDEDSYDNC